ncbi:MAG: YhbY family RNA-binding protein [Myxococcales bacterium]|nr:YhbY family RNA-binding protein [Myxococcales bacterium]
MTNDTSDGEVQEGATEGEVQEGATEGIKPAGRELTGKQRRHLRALGHHLVPLVQVGKGGVTSGVVASVRAALLTHELVKVKRSGECPAKRADIAVELASALGAAIAQELGHTILFYKRHPKKPVIVLPR